MIGIPHVNKCWLVCLVATLSFVKDCEAWTFPTLASSSIAAPVTSTMSDGAVKIPESVAVTGATGRTGRYVVEELLARGVNVVALVRDEEKAEELLDCSNDLLQVKTCDLMSKSELTKSLKDCDAAIWCATGFSSADNGIMEKLKGLFGLATKRTIDTVGLPLLANCLPTSNNDEESVLPKVVLCSSSGVTRPSWEDEKKEALNGCADIPIVRLNPFGILDLKKESEQLLRDTNIPYSIVRPCGLQEDENVWRSNSRPVLSQGDVAVGRIHRRDVAKLLVDCCLTLPESTGKTFEVFSIQGDNYLPPKTLQPILQSMTNDDSITGQPYVPDLPVLQATYLALQQLLPGEKQDAASLAMGQTYEQLDEDEVGRLGKRGEEQLSRADGTFQPSS